MRRNVTIEDVGNVAAFLLSDLASGVTAEITYVDGGFSQRRRASRRRQRLMPASSDANRAQPISSAWQLAFEVLISIAARSHAPPAPALAAALGALSACGRPAGHGPRQRTASPLMLANVYRRGMPLADYWVSEKYDGVRGYWDGKQLLTRGGERVDAPAWFTAGWPATPLDGELWAGRGQFAQAVSTVRQQTPDDAAWREHALHGVRPARAGRPDFTDRLPVCTSCSPTIDGALGAGRAAAARPATPRRCRRCWPKPSGWAAKA